MMFEGAIAFQLEGVQAAILELVALCKYVEGFKVRSLSLSQKDVKP
jgi:hypothetical protein